VGDTAIGVSPEVAARACVPSVTTKPLGQGAGLGLSMIDGFAGPSEGHVEGHVRIASLAETPGKDDGQKGGQENRIRLRFARPPWRLSRSPAGRPA
jgi:hypothetical protein